MQEKPKVEELIADSMTLLLVRAQKLPQRERLAIAQEFREWLNGCLLYTSPSPRDRG